MELTSVKQYAAGAAERRVDQRRRMRGAWVLPSARAGLTRWQSQYRSACPPGAANKSSTKWQDRQFIDPLNGAQQ